MTPHSSCERARLCPCCSAPLVSMADLAAVALRADALVRHLHPAIDVETAAGIRLLASVLPCAAGTCGVNPLSLLAAGQPAGSAAP